MTSVKALFPVGFRTKTIWINQNGNISECGVPLIFRLLKLWIFMREVLKKLYFLAERPNSLFRLFLF
uniref:Uncharacterized protein n=1 Tax=Myoviridae sp. ct2AC8 TaxID=2827655 RepID=A0A8S5TPV9_9CAUD|nr:MAG TPA: hypothetical protein [Myoviridae sp. ct2AC8]